MCKQEKWNHKTFAVSTLIDTRTWEHARTHTHAHTLTHARADSQNWRPVKVPSKPLLFLSAGILAGTEFQKDLCYFFPFSFLHSSSRIYFHVSPPAKRVIMNRLPSVMNVSCRIVLMTYIAATARHNTLARSKLPKLLKKEKLWPVNYFLLLPCLLLQETTHCYCQHYLQRLLGSCFFSFLSPQLMRWLHLSFAVCEGLNASQFVSLGSANCFTSICQLWDAGRCVAFQITSELQQRKPRYPQNVQRVTKIARANM